MNHCHSCGMALAGEEATAARGNLCQYCSTENGDLKPRAEAEMGLAEWLKSWSPPASDEEFLRRARSYMDAMPAWNQA